MIENFYIMSKTHQIIKSKRENLGYSQEYMAHELGITQPTYALIESGKSKITLERAIQLSKILDTELNELAGVDNSEFSIKNNTFSDNSSVIQNYHAQNTALIEKLIQGFREEIGFLRQQLNKK